jgi:hypothetical protein
MQWSRDASYEVRCSRQGCSAFEKLPMHLLDKPEDRTHQWLMGRAWSTETSEQYLCPEHW